MGNVSRALETVQSEAEAMGGYLHSIGSRTITVEAPADRFQEMIQKVESPVEVTGRGYRTTSALKP